MKKRSTGGKNKEARTGPASSPVEATNDRARQRIQEVPTLCQILPAKSPASGHPGGLFEKLRALRLEIARRQSMAPFIIFHDTTLKEMVKYLPRTLTEMRAISGTGERKLELYGEQFLALIEEHLSGPSVRGAR